MQNTHIESAINIKNETNIKDLKPVLEKTRQGDVIMRRVGNVPAGSKGSPTPKGGILISAGAHGEHRLIADSYEDGGPGFINLISEGLLVHTDCPTGRHKPKLFSPGRWEIGNIRELAIDGTIVKVKD